MIGRRLYDRCGRFNKVCLPLGMEAVPAIAVEGRTERTLLLHDQTPLPRMIDRNQDGQVIII